MEHCPNCKQELLINRADDTLLGYCSTCGFEGVLETGLPREKLARVVPIRAAPVKKKKEEEKVKRIKLTKDQGDYLRRRRY